VAQERGSIFPTVVAATPLRVVAMCGVSSIMVLDATTEMVMHTPVLAVVEDTVLHRRGHFSSGFGMDRSLPLKARGSRSVLCGGLPKPRGRALGLLDHCTLHPQWWMAPA
jgi:hypothetical protein